MSKLIHWLSVSANSEVGACLSNLRFEFYNIILGKYLKREADSFTQSTQKTYHITKACRSTSYQKPWEDLYSGVHAGPADGLDFWGST